MDDHSASMIEYLYNVQIEEFIEYLYGPEIDDPENFALDL
jgi:hypothetical protein